MQQLLCGLLVALLSIAMGALVALIVIYFGIQLLGWSRLVPKEFSPVFADPAWLLLSWAVPLLLAAYPVGILHGRLFGRQGRYWLALGYAGPVVPTSVALALATAGMGMVGLPLVFVFPLLLGPGNARGAKLRATPSTPV